jgi:hypothetical protein
MATMSADKTGTRKPGLVKKDPPNSEWMINSGAIVAEEGKS